MACPERSEVNRKSCHQRWVDSGEKLAQPKRPNSDVRLGLLEANDAVAVLPLATLFQYINALEALEDVAFNDEAGDPLEAFVL